ncbi:MAG: proteobacterial dedicated sortase system histidine kinase [Alteromonadaceae bacterium]|jgi:dedicated sortase system histidine kinase|nr:proteobacterial dedicated sortase system histidine kinase [Alteromonadaceae bacterium]MBB19748.1 proteobacterial dedicated sortase system histidine kinase [Rickettsiales bacterium]
MSRSTSLAKSHKVSHVRNKGRFRFRFGIRLKLLALSIFLFAIPWLGYQYVWELESYLRIGQEQTMVGTARAVATALHERPTLFDTQSAYLTDVKPGTDLYAHKIHDPIRLDGKLDDWLDYQHLSLEYGPAHLLDYLNDSDDYQRSSLHFRHMVGQFGEYLYAMFEVTDENVLLRSKNSLRVDRNDYLQIAMTGPDGSFKRYVVAPQEAGWVNAYLLSESVDSMRPVSLETQIQGRWLNTANGYNIELRFPLAMMSSKIAFAITDVDDPQTRQIRYRIGTANPNKSDALGTVLVPSPEIENIIKGLKYSNARVWVIDKHKRVLARSGGIHKSVGLSSSAYSSNGDQQASWWQSIEQEWLLPLYYQILTKPPADFIDDLQDAYALQGQDIDQALMGKPASLWRLSPDNKAVILSAAHPIFIDEKVMGAVVVEQTTNGIRTLRNLALEKLFHVILAVMGLGTLALFLFASRISFRIRKLRNQTEAAIDQHGKIIGTIPSATAGDEIGDLANTFNIVLGKLGQYNAYLQNMSARLSHELRTPVAIVKSSLENLQLSQQTDEDAQYIERAQLGIKRLSTILNNMSEATRLEQAVQSNEREEFTVNALLSGYVEGYRMTYASHKFAYANEAGDVLLLGSSDLFGQMLDKIIANALEFSPEHSLIVIKLRQYASKHLLTIENDGPPLPNDMEGKLFDSMVSVRPEHATSQPHLGLGLFIAKAIAQFHGGDIQIENRTLETGEHLGVRVSLLF